MDDMVLLDLARQAGTALSQQELMLATAESCTGGWLGQTITSIAGSSAWYERGFITYAAISKHEMLGVSNATLEQYGAVSEQTASEMSAGAIARSHAQVAVSITGIAGPDGIPSVEGVGAHPALLAPGAVKWSPPSGSAGLPRELVSGAVLLPPSAGPRP